MFFTCPCPPPALVRHPPLEGRDWVLCMLFSFPKAGFQGGSVCHIDELPLRAYSLLTLNLLKCLIAFWEEQV